MLTACPLLLQIVDSMGSNDSNSVRKAQQRALEERVDNVIILTPKDLQANEQLESHVVNSPFLDNWFSDRQGSMGEGADRHFFSIMLFW